MYTKNKNDHSLIRLKELHLDKSVGQSDNLFFLTFFFLIYVYIFQRQSIRLYLDNNVCMLFSTLSYYL